MTGNLYKFKLKPVKLEDIESVKRSKDSFWRSILDEFVRSNQKAVKVEMNIDCKTILGAVRQYIYSEKYGYKDRVNVVKRQNSVYLVKVE